MGQFPNKDAQFKKGYASGNHTQKGPHLTSILKKLLKGKWKINDPQVKELLKTLKLPANFASSIMLRRLLNATEGDDLAIERILDRIDGKVIDKTEFSGGLNITQMGKIEINQKPFEVKIG